MSKKTIIKFQTPDGIVTYGITQEIEEEYPIEQFIDITKRFLIGYCKCTDEEIVLIEQKEEYGED